MASRKKQISIPAPHTGVRKDVNELIQDGSMAADGQNCVYFDGTIRPRPAMDSKITSNATIDNYQAILNMEDDYSSLLGPGDFDNLSHVVQANDGSFILGMSSTGKKYWLSTDDGTTWSTPSLAWPNTSDNISQALICGDYIVLITNESPVPTTIKMYRGEIADILDGTLSWTLIESLPYPAEYYYSYQHEVAYDEENDLITDIWSAVEQVPAGFGTPYYKKPSVWVVYDVTGATPTTDVIGWDENMTYGTRILESKWVNGKTLVSITERYPWDYYAIPELDIYGLFLQVDSLEYNSGTGVLDLTRGGNGATIFLNGGTYNATRENPLGLEEFESAPSGISAEGLVETAGDDEEIQFLVTGDRLGAQKTRIVKCGIDDDGMLPDTLDTVLVMEPDIVEGVSYQQNLQDVGATSEKIVFGVQGTNMENSLPNVYVSSDGGVTYALFEPGFVPVKTLIGKFFYFNDYTDKHFMIATHGYDGSKYASVLYLLPSSIGTSKQGKFTDIVQTDTDDEENAIFAGTTRGVAKVGSDGQFSLITANELQCVPTGGTYSGPWTSAGQIPPLSADPSSDEYESGVTIDSTYGENPWVFRSFMSNGHIFLIGTNGQSYPICYNPSMAGGFARRLGEVPSGDPNDYTISAEDIKVGWLQTGNLAPRARCLAVAANRVILANDPTGTGFEVNVGGFNDCDRGWGTPDSQLVLLGDTPGKIVTMSEISALQVAVYKEDAIYHAVAQNEFGGVVAPFRFEMSKSGIAGPCSPASVVRNHDGRQIFLARDGGVYMYDGVAPLDGGRNIRRMIQGDIDLDQLGKVWGMVDRQRKLVWFFYPTKDGLVNKGVVISTDQGYPFPTWPVSLPNGWNFTCGSQIAITDDVSMEDLGEFGSYQTESLSSFSSGQVEMLMGRETGVFYAQKWFDDGDYSDSGVPIKIKLRTGWTTPGGVGITSADELYHIFSSPDPEQELEVRLRAQKIGQNIIERGPRTLYAAKPRRRTRHRVGGMQFAVDLRGSVSRLFNWGGATLTGSSGGRNRG